ncbi:DNA polymerase I [Treponema sp. OMZ 840]|uniref:DNA polymerase I n=1 Tax=Treponema sp. OMZ 840 TaxID=244313 RepID=UPI003D9477D4
MSDNTLYILDSYALIYRSYFAFINRPLINDKKQNISAVFGFFRNFFNMLQNCNPAFVAAAFDSRTPTFRHAIYDEYKATRAKTPEDLHAQIPLIEEILHVLGVPVLRCDGFEADDIIATLAARCKAEKRSCRILSGDKDLMQLIDDTTLMMKSDKTGGWELIGEKQVLDEWGVPPAAMLDILSLTGDSADNIPGVPGIGQKTAQKLLTEYGSLDGIYAQAEKLTGSVGDKIRKGKESAFFSKSLIRLRTDVPLDISFESLQLKHIDYAEAARMLNEHGAFSVAKQYATAAAKTADIPDTPSALNMPHDGAAQNTAAHNSLPNAESTVVFDEPEAQTVVKNSGDYRLVRTDEELATIIDTILSIKTAAFDCETDSLNAHKARLVGFSLALEAGKAYYIPLETSDMLLAGEMIAKQSALSELERLFYNPDIVLIMHNGKYDAEVLLSNGMGKGKIPLCKIYDTMLAAWLLQPDRESFKLEALAERKLGLKGIEFSDIVSKGATFADVPLDIACSYAAEDADLTLQLWAFFKPRLDESGLSTLFYSLETPVLPILTAMEIEGIRIEKEKLADFSIELKNQIEKVERDIYTLVGHEFNIASTKQLQEVLFVERKLKPTKKTKTGFSTDTAVLEELAAWDPVPQKILEYRMMTKLKSTYVDALPLLADENGRIHTSFIQTGTATGRLSSRDPNLQNIPIREESGRRIREAFSAPQGRCLVSADYAQIELVVLAHLSQDSNLCAAFKQGKDVHRETASLIFGVEPEQVSAEQRRTAKTINFGVMYGMSAFRLANQLGIPRSKAQEFIDSYFATYSGIREFIHTTIEKAEQTGYVETIMGRRRLIAGITSKNKTEKAGAERIAVNTPIQGSAADIVKTAMIAVDRALKNEIPSAKLLLQVHDELIVECAESQAEQTAALLKKEMEAAVLLSVPLKVSVEYGSNWGGFH